MLTAIHIWVLTALSDVPKNALMRRCCLSHLKNSSGTPDQILLRKDKGYSIIAYESANFTSAKDSLLPVYKVRLNAYALIAESIGLKPVRQIGLIHYRPQTDIIDTTICELGRLVSYDNFLMGFGSHCLQIELKPGEVVKPWLK